MPIPKEIAEDMIGSPTPGDVRVYVGPCTVSAFKGKKIPLDGRRYACDGRVFLRSGHELRAKFSVDTTDFDFIDLKSLVLFHNSLWYRWDEEELYNALGIGIPTVLSERVVLAGGELRTQFAVVREFRNGRIAAQRNYDCFEPF